MKILVIPLTWIIGIGIRAIGRSRVEVIDIVDLVTSVLGRTTPNLTIQSQMVNEITNFS